MSRLKKKYLNGDLSDLVTILSNDCGGKLIRIRRETSSIFSANMSREACSSFASWYSIASDRYTNIAVESSLVLACKKNTERYYGAEVTWGSLNAGSL